MNRLTCFETFTPYETETENQRMVVICGPRCYTYKCVAVFLSDSKSWLCDDLIVFATQLKSLERGMPPGSIS